MAKVGRFVNDPRAGSYCYVTVDTGEKLLVSHEKSGQKGRLTVALVKLWGLSSEHSVCRVARFAGRAGHPRPPDGRRCRGIRGCDPVRRARALPEGLRLPGRGARQVRNTGRAVPLREARGRRHPVLDQPLEELAQRWHLIQSCSARCSTVLDSS